MIDLNEKFGLAIQPARVDPAEELYTPQSRFELNSETASFLRDFMSGVSKGFAMTEFLCQSATLLWLVDHRGVLILCVEERVDMSDSARRVPNSFQLDYGQSWQKLGHPSMVDGNGARIGGELYFDTSFEESRWILNNKSGRFGLRRLGRSAEQLDHVVQELSALDINVQAHMIDDA